MHYFEVFIADGSYQADEPLTYSYESTLKPGTVVTVLMRGKAVSGFVGKQVKKPSFKTLSIKSVLSDHLIPAHVLPTAHWLRDYYGCSLGDGLRQFAINKTVKKRSVHAEISTINTKFEPSSLKATDEQTKALKKISGSMSSTILLHGQTASGKTYIYIQCIKNTVSTGKSAIVLVPEIALTSQLVSSISAELSDEVLVFHSNLSQAERKRLWFRVLETTKPLIIIGPRSALFVPVQNIGLIIVDEAHEQTYKQEQTPRYSALRVASKLAQLTGCRAILGTATPSIVDYYLAEKHDSVVSLRSPAIKSSQKVDVEIVDLKDKSNLSPNQYFSKTLLSSIEHTLNNSQQVLIFLNRRGSARLIMCSSCGWQLLCPNCDTPLTYHADTHHGMCHGCGYKTTPPNQCPTCKSPDIIYKSVGTKAVAEALAKLFVNHKVVRFDGDNKGDERFESQYKAVHAGQVDIIVGTQIVAKGLDLPKLGMVGLITAETSLYLPDYTADERTFQLIYQLVGRVGRGHSQITAKAIIQTYQPDSEIIKSAVSRDYQSFYERVLAERRAYRFPPYSYNLKLVCRRKTVNGAESSSKKLYNELVSKKFIDVQIIGPMPSFHHKRSGSYYYQIIAKSKSRTRLVELTKFVPNNWSIDLDPTHLL